MVFGANLSYTRSTGLVVLLMVISIACSSAETVKKQYTVGVENVSYKPYYSSVDGRYEGFVRALLDRFADSAGIEFRYKPFPIKRLHGAFLKGSIDFMYPDNPNWIVSDKKSKNVQYSATVVQVVDGLMVRSENKTGDIAKIKRLGTISGYSLPAYQGLIDRGVIKLTEVGSFEGLLGMVILKRIDAAYVSINPALFKLHHSMDNIQALQFDSGLPYDIADHSLSTLKHSELLGQFNKFLDSNQALVDRLRENYEIIEVVPR